MVLPKIAVRVLLEIKGVVSTRDCSFQVPEDRVDPGKAVHLGTLSFADDVPLVDTTGLLYYDEAGKTV